MHPRSRRPEVTKYKVFELSIIGASKETGLVEHRGWLELKGEYEAPNDEAAIKAALTAGNGDRDPSGEYFATPVRSFKVRKVEAKQAYSFS